VDRHTGRSFGEDDVPNLRHAESRANLRALAHELNARGVLGLGVGEQDAADAMYALAADESVFLRLTHECGWTPDRYADLIARTLKATLTQLGGSREP